MKFSINDFFSKYDQIRSFLRIWSHLLKKSLMENFIFFFAVTLAILASLVKMNIFKLLGILANSAPQPEEKKNSTSVNEALQLV